MSKQSAPVLAKAASTGGGSAVPRDRYNATTMAALREADDIMSGTKKVKWKRFSPETTLSEAKEELKKMLGS